VIIFGSYRGVTELAMKNDECANCGAIGVHHIVRKSYWIHVFWVPVLLVWVRHGMICAGCGEWTGLSFMTVRNAMKTGGLPLERARPNFAANRHQMADELGRLPNAAQVFDKLTINPRRGGFDLYLKVWLVAAALVLLLLIVVIIVYPPGRR
jgi:hypothetical protein